jgi:hypothetical protein
VLEGKRRLRLVKPTLQTPFFIDFDWWKQNDRDWRVYLRNYLSDEDKAAIANMEEEGLIDLVDPETAEIHRVDALQHLVITKYAQQENFIQENTSFTEAIFRLLLSNGNAPLSPVEIGEILNREAGTVLRMLSGPRVYKGIRPHSLS